LIEKIEVLNNREISIAIWLGVLFFYTSYKNRSLGWMNGLARAFLARSVIFMYLFSVFYTCVAIYLLRKLNWWSIAQLKDTLLWCTFSILTTLMGITAIKEKKSYFKDALLDNLKATLIVEFIAETYTFSLPVELVLVPLLALLGGVQAVAVNDKQHSKLVPILSRLTVIFSLGLIIHSIYEIIRLRDYANLDKLKDFTLPPILAIWFLPWLYALAVYMRFESAFVVFKMKFKDKPIYRVARKKAIRAFLFDPEGLKRWSKMLFLKDAQSAQDVMAIISEVKRLKKIEKNPPPVQATEGWSPYQAKDFLLDAGIETRFYENVYEDKWSASSDYQKVDDAFAANTIAYYVSGTEHIAMELKLYLSVTSPETQVAALNYLNRLADLLCVKAILLRLPDTYHKKIRLGRNGESQIGPYQLSLKREGYGDDNKRYGYEFTIRLSIQT
jgi:hypothetical protein